MSNTVSPRISSPQGLLDFAWRLIRGEGLLNGGLFDAISKSIIGCFLTICDFSLINSCFPFLAQYKNNKVPSSYGHTLWLGLIGVRLSNNL